MCYIFIICTLILTGCKKDKYENITNNTLIIKKNGDVYAVSFYKLSDYNDINTFNYLDDNRMTEYNYLVDCISIERVDSRVIGDEIRLTTKYATFLAYEAYMGVDFMAGTVEESLIGYTYEGKRFIDYSTKEEVAKDVVIQDESLYCVIIDHNMDLQLEGKILYYSDNVNVTSQNTATVTGDTLSYIIYK